MRRRVFSLLSALAVALGVLLIAAPASAAPGDVVINEADVAADFVELYNSGSDPADISGWYVWDDKSRDTGVVPDGTVLQPGEFYVLDSAALGFGLGKQDEARLFDAAGNQVDGFSWTAEPATSYGRYTDGSATWVVTASSTPGQPNTFTSPVRVNEIESSGGTPGDWVELVNPSLLEVDASGLMLRDGVDTNSYTLPPGSTIPAGGYLVVHEADFAFGLGAGDAVRLYAADGTTLLDSYSWTAHASTTYGRCPDTSGEFATTVEPTPSAPNSCPAVAGQGQVVINETVSTGGVPGDWVELYNTGSTDLDLAGWWILDNDDSHTAVPFPAGTTIPAGGFLVIEEAHFGFGLGAADSGRLFAPDGTLIDSHTWTSHAPTSYARCPDGAVDFQASTAVTKGAANDCSSPVRVNEIESSGGTPGDWVELANPTAEPIDVSGYSIRDNNDANVYLIPAGTTIPAMGYVVLDEADFGFGLGASDSVRLYDADGMMIDSYTWTAHAATTYGRCPDMTGAFAETVEPTKGATNKCVGDVVVEPWPGPQEVAVADLAETFTGDLSGLDHQASGTGVPGIMWGVVNGTGTLYQLTPDRVTWVPAGGEWAAGKTLLYPDGTGRPDAEGVTVGPDGRIYVGSERNNAVGSVSRNSVLMYDVTAAGTTLTAIRERNLTAALPTTGANTGIEAVEWVPNSELSGLIDQATGAPYNPASYPLAGGGLFFVGLEATGSLHAFALDSDGTYALIASFDSGLAGVMALDYDLATSTMWVVCDEGCQGQAMQFSFVGGEPAVPAAVTSGPIARPDGMPNLNNEGFAISDISQCVDGLRPVYWADDGDSGGHSLRTGYLFCTAVAEPPVDVPVDQPGATPGTGGSTPGGSSGTPGAVRSGGTGASTTASGSGRGGLATTGADLFPGVSLAAAALLAGSALLVAARRRRDV